MKSTLKSFFILLSLALLVACKGEPTLKYLEKAKELNKKLPVEFSRGLRLDSVTAISTYQFKYHYTLLKDPKEQKSSFINSSRPQILNSLKTTTSSAELKEDNMSIIYAYYKLDGSFYAEIVVSPSEY